MAQSAELGLHRRVVRLAEDASDDAAVVVTRDRATYAEVLLDFMQRGAHGTRGHGVAMARYGRPDERINRILDSKAVSTGVTRWAVAAIVVLATPLAYVTAATQPSRARQTRTVATVPAAGAVSGARAGPAASTFVAAPQAPTLPNRPASPATEDSGRIRRYMIFLDDSTSGSWDSRDPVDEDALRRRFGRRFAWFRHAGHEYVVTDAGVLREFEQAMEPQRNVNRMQSDVNGRQSKVNELQAKVNAQQDEVNRLQRDVNLRQNKVNALQTEVNRRQDMMNGIQAAAGSEKKEALIRKLEAAINQLRAAAGEGDQESANRRQSEVNAAQSRVNEAQAKVNEAQSRVNQEQDLVNEAQQKVNEEQRRVSAQYNARMREIFDTILQRGLAQRLN